MSLASGDFPENLKIRILNEVAESYTSLLNLRAPKYFMVCEDWFQVFGRYAYYDLKRVLRILAHHRAVAADQPAELVVGCEAEEREDSVVNMNRINHLYLKHVTSFHAVDLFERQQGGGDHIELLKWASEKGAALPNLTSASMNSNQIGVIPPLYSILFANISTINLAWMTRPAGVYPRVVRDTYKDDDDEEEMMYEEEDPDLVQDEADHAFQLIERMCEHLHGRLKQLNFRSFCDDKHGLYVFFFNKLDKVSQLPITGFAISGSTPGHTATNQAPVTRARNNRRGLQRRRTIFDELEKLTSCEVEGLTELTLKSLKFPASFRALGMTDMLENLATLTLDDVKCDEIADPTEEIMVRFINACNSLKFLALKFSVQDLSVKDYVTEEWECTQLTRFIIAYKDPTETDDELFEFKQILQERLTNLGWFEIQDYTS